MPYYMNSSQGSPVLSQQNNSADVLQVILQRLDNMDANLGQLSSIQVTVNKINEPLNSMEQRMSELEKKPIIHKR